jgi:hypothetical protein
VFAENRLTHRAGVPAAFSPPGVYIVNSEQARQLAEKRFKHEEQARDGRNALAEYEALARATREKTARLRALRLAKEAVAQNEAPAARPTERRVRRRK